MYFMRKLMGFSQSYVCSMFSNSFTLRKVMYRRIEDFKNAWAFETGATLQVFNNLTDDSLRYSTPAFGRGLGRLAQHIAESPSAMMNNSGFTLITPEYGQTAVSTANLIEDYRTSSGAVLEEISNWSDK